MDAQSTSFDLANQRPQIRSVRRSVNNGLVRVGPLATSPEHLAVILLELVDPSVIHFYRDVL